MNKIILTAILVLALGNPVFAKTYSVSVSQFVEHPSLDAVLKGFQDSLKAQDVPAKYSTHNAQANMATANQIASLIAGEKPDLGLITATPLKQVPMYGVREPAVRMVAGWYQFLDAIGR